MSTDVTVAVVSDGAVRAYHRNGRELAQVAQLAAEADIDPAALAAAMADLGDLLGWHSERVAGQPAGAVGSAAGALPAAPPAELPPARPPRRVTKRPQARRPPEVVEAERQHVLAIIRGQPGILRADVARIAGTTVASVKRCTDALLRAELIDVAPVPGVRARGVGGGHGLFARMVHPDAPMS